MNHPCIVLRNSIFFFIASGFSGVLAQPFATQGFYQHLKAEGLLMEQVAFTGKLINHISATPTEKDSLLLDLSAVYYNLKMPDSAGANLRRISGPARFPQAKRQLYFSLLMLTRQYNPAAEQLEAQPLESFHDDLRVSLVILNREKFNKDTLQIQASSFAMDMKHRYEHTPHPSPFWAGAFSAVLPGAGKWYAGYKQQAFTALIANTLFAAQAAESYARGGISSPQFIITAGLFSIFYSGNIWGSVLAAKKRTRDHLKEIDYEILDHYHTEFSKLSR